MANLIRHAVEDMLALEKAGFDGVLVENENDQPHRIFSAPETTAAMTLITDAMVRAAQSIRVGVEVLLNDPKASLAIASVCGAEFIRTDYFVDRMARDEYGGEMQIDPDGLMAYRAAIGARDVAVFADVQVKYARMLEDRPIAISAVLAEEKGADGIVVTGNLTGHAPVVADLQAVKESGVKIPVIVGSGLTAQNAADVMRFADGAIVGTGIMTKGRIDSSKAGELRGVIQSIPVTSRK